MIYVKHCPKCKSRNLGGDNEELKQCLSCGTLWFEPIPNSPQERFLRCSIREVGFGGEAGGSKSFSLVLDPVYQLRHKDYHALLLRRSYPQLMGDDGLVSLSRKVYPAIGGHFSKSELLWTFSDYPGSIRFGHIEHDNELEQKYEGHQYAHLGFDELQTFSERMYLYLFSRNRSSNPKIKLYTRSTFMPGGIGHHWVKKRFILPFKNGSGYTDQPKYFRRIGGVDTEVPASDEYAIPRVFIPSKLEDNPYLYQDGKGEYEKGLHQLDPVDYHRKKGDWDIQRTGRVYHAFNDKCTFSYDSLDLKRASFYHAHDFGAVNETWGLFAYLDGVYHLIHEEKLPEGTTATRAKKIKSHLEGRKVVAGYGGAPSEKQQRTDYTADGITVRRPAMTDVEGGVNAVNKMFEEGTLKVCLDCTFTIDQLENCIRDAKEGIQDKSTWHHLDVLRYLAAGVKSQGWARGSA